MNKGPARGGFRDAWRAGSPMPPAPNDEPASTQAEDRGRPDPPSHPSPIRTRRRMTGEITAIFESVEARTRHPAGASGAAAVHLPDCEASRSAGGAVQLALDERPRPARVRCAAFAPGRGGPDALAW